MADNIFSILAGLGHYLPERVVGNDFFAGKMLYKIGYGGQREKAIETSSQWIEQNMGILTRRYAHATETVHDMAAAAIRMALQHAHFDAPDLEGILAATVTSDKSYPSTACEIQRLLDIRPSGKPFVASDIGAACAGYLFALIEADRLVRSRDIHRGLAVVGVEKLSSVTDFEDANAPLFGDGAGASIVIPSSYCNSSRQQIAGKIAATYQTSEVMDGACMLIYRDPSGKLRMPEGNKVLKQAVRSMTAAVGNIKEKTGWSNHDLTLVIPHQANIRIIDGVLRLTELSPEKIYINIDKYGNMSSATCPVALSQAYREGRIQEGSKVILASFGSGLVTAAVGLEYMVI